MSDPDPTPSYAAELAVAEDAARSAGAILQRYAENGVRYGFKQHQEWRREVVSEADLAADDAIRHAILAAFPHDAWLSEEHPDDGARLAHSRVWIVDPLDGTREFLSGVPEYAVSIALVVDGLPVLGVVFNPAKDQLVADRHPGLAADGALAAAAALSDSYLLVGRGEWRWGGMPPVPAGTRVLPIGSIAYRLALLSRGTGGLIFTVTDRSEWDIAAGVALASAAGATVTDLHGLPLAFNKPDPVVTGCIVGNAALHAEALALWKQHGWH